MEKSMIIFKQEHAMISLGVKLEKTRGWEMSWGFPFFLGRGWSVIKKQQCWGRGGRNGFRSLDSDPRKILVLNSTRDFYAKMDQCHTKLVEIIYCNYFELGFPLLLRVLPSEKARAWIEKLDLLQGVFTGPCSRHEIMKTH